MGFDYFYDGEEDSFVFIRIPKVLFTSPLYQDLTNDARMLYGMILDRMALSKKNGWRDETGRIFIYFTLKEIESQLFVGHVKAVQLLDSLEGHSLIRRIRQGMGRPSRIYPRRFSTALVRDQNFMKYENDTSKGTENELHDVRKTNSNNTEKNKTDKSDIQSYPSLADGMRCEAPADLTVNEVDRKCGFKTLIADMPDRESEILEVRELILEVLRNDEPAIRICGTMKPTDSVKQHFHSLTSEHIRYVLASLDDNPADIRNIKQYLLASLYNATLTIGSYYPAKVNHDLYG